MTAEQLKNSILQMAVQGKLVPQDPNDEPASELINRIREEKEKLIKEGKIKKEKNPSYIFRGEDNIPYEKVGNNEPVSIVDEVPFEIPESWEWVRLGTLMSVISDGTHKTPNYVNEGVPFLSVQNISKGYFDLTKLKYITEEEHQTLIQRIRPQYGDILFCRIGTLGKAIKCTVDFEFSIFVSLGLLRPLTSCITDYIVFAINSPLGDKWIQENKVGGGTHTYKINLVDIPNMLIPLPPVAEQQRIFEKMTDLQRYIEAYGKTEAKLTSLQSSFPENLKKSILLDAVMGKLVPQNENDEPASVLLDRIRKEKQRLIAEGKLKKDKHESIIYRRDNSHYEKLDGIERCIDDEIPFEIPDSWIWSRLNDCLDVRDGTHDTPKYVVDGVPLVTSKNLRDGSIDFSNVKLISREDHEAISLRSKVDNDDILFAMIGSIGNPVLYHGDAEFSIKNMALFKHIQNGMYMEYVYWWLFLSQNVMKKQASGGVQSFVSLKYLRNYYIPVPPYDEQKRIVERIRELSIICENL